MQNDNLTYVGNGLCAVPQTRWVCHPERPKGVEGSSHPRPPLPPPLRNRLPFRSRFLGFHFGRQRECGTARFFQCHCSAAVSAWCRLSPDSFFPPPLGGQQILPNIHHNSPAPQLPPASTVCWRPRRIRRVYVRAAGGGCGRACAQGGARLMQFITGFAPPFDQLQGADPLSRRRLSSAASQKPRLGRDSGQAVPPPRFRCCN